MISLLRPIILIPDTLIKIRFADEPHIGFYFRGQLFFFFVKRLCKPHRARNIRAFKLVIYLKHNITLNNIMLILGYIYITVNGCIYYENAVKDDRDFLMLTRITEKLRELPRSTL